MKKIFLMALVIAIVGAYGNTPLQAEEKERPVCKSRYQFPGDCVACHIPPTGELGDPLPEGIKRDGETVYIYVEHMDFKTFRDKLFSVKRYRVSKIIVDLFSFGGSLFDSLAMGAILGEHQKEGKTIEIRARGIIASAALILMVSGSKGNRFIDRSALVMFHELSTFKFFSFETPSDKEEETKILRMIQDKVNAYIADRSQISQAELCEKIKRKEFWMDAEMAIKYGFADAILN